VQAFLIRHPRPDIAAGVCYGATDLDLADRELECVVHLRKLLPEGIALFSSPMRRCRRLAEALHANACYEPRLREMSFGAWELQRWSEIPRIELDAWAAAPMTYVPPGGESVASVQARVAAFLRERCAPQRPEQGRRQGQDFAVVTHAGVMRVMVGKLLGLDEASWFKLRFDYGELTHIQVAAPS
jgi:alpha-ribazole phosphatase